MAVLGKTFVDAAVINQAKLFHIYILETYPNACWYNDPCLFYDIILDVVGLDYSSEAELIFKGFEQNFSQVQFEAIHWGLANRPRPQVALMCVREAAIGGPVWAAELFKCLNDLLGWSQLEIETAAAGAELNYADRRELDSFVQKKPTLVALRAVKRRWNEMDDERQRKAQALRTLTLERIGEIEDELRARGEPLVRRRSRGFISDEVKQQGAEAVKAAKAKKRKEKAKAKKRAQRYYGSYAR